MQNDNGHHFAYGRLKRPLKKEALGGAKIIPQKTPLCASWAINFFYRVDSYLQSRFVFLGAFSLYNLFIATKDEDGKDY
jgi:hypothetical protein